MRIGILVVAYNASSTLERVLDRIPVELRPRIAEVLVGDDHSHDNTYEVGIGYQRKATDLPLTVVRHPRNLGYGGNQKWGYRQAIARGWDVVVLLHGDGQYAPELLPEMVAPIESGGADAVLGSRMLMQGGARRGGMPLYKFAGNRILTRFENAVTGLGLSEWHSGYRAYSVEALKEIPFGRNSDGFDFDTEVILQLAEAGRRIVEIPIPTYYGDEVCYVNGVAYAWDVAKDVLRWRLQRAGFGSGDLAFVDRGYELKDAETSSHRQLVEWCKESSPGRVLDLGCSGGLLGEQLRNLGYEVTGVDVEHSVAAAERLDRFFVADLDSGIPEEAGRGYDLVLAADVLEHVRRPDQLLAQCLEVLAPGGRVLASVPNVAHWYPRARFALGRFDYDRRGILDSGHLRFFSASGFERLARKAGFRALRREATGLPLEIVDRGRPAVAPSTAPSKGRLARAVASLDRRATTLWPNLFAYQWIYELVPEI